MISEIYCQLFHIVNNKYFCLRWIKVKTVFYKFPTTNKRRNGVTNACKSIFASTEFVHSFSNQNFRGEVFFCLFCPGVTFAANSSAMEVLVATFLATEGYLHAVCHSPT